MRFLARILQNSGDRTGLLKAVRSLADSLGVQVKNPKWTSYGALEIDVFAPREADFDLLLTLLEPLGRIEFHRNLSEAPPHMSDGESFAEARRLFNSERYWESHEVLEERWRTLQGQEKSFVQGLILVCAAFVHHQKGEGGIATGVLVRALNQLSYPEEEYKGIDVVSLKRSVEGILSTRTFESFRI